MDYEQYYLGIDGGQSHTTALIADVDGIILGRGLSGPSNHTREPGGRERLERAVSESVSDALRAAGLMERGAIGDFYFRSAHLAMTGEPEDKISIVQQILSAENLVVGHDANLQATIQVLSRQARDGRRLARAQESAQHQKTHTFHGCLS